MKDFLIRRGNPMSFGRNIDKSYAYIRSLIKRDRKPINSGNHVATCVTVSVPVTLRRRDERRLSCVNPVIPATGTTEFKTAVCTSNARPWQKN